MPFGLGVSTHRSSRRRRVLVEETRGMDSRSVPTTGGGGDRPAKVRPRYPLAASTSAQPRITDFLPRRAWTLGVVYLLISCFVVAHATIHAVAQRRMAGPLRDALRWLTLGEPVSLARWSSSSMLLLATGIGVLLLRLRHHRVDDYRGTYRLWYYAVAGTLAASIDATVHWGESFVRLIVASGLWPTGGGAAWIALVALTVAVIGVVTRLLMELRDSRLACTTLVLSTASYLLATATAYGWLTVASADIASLLSGVARLAADGLLTLALLAYARAVVLQIERQVPVTGTPLVADATQAAAPPLADEKVSAKAKAAPKPVPKPVPKPAPAPKAAPEPPGGSIDEEEGADIVSMQLSKAERRRLRKQKRREQRHRPAA